MQKLKLLLIWITLILAKEQFNQLCWSKLEDICYPCLKKDLNYNEVICKPISDDIKIIIFENKTDIDYEKYLKTQIRIVQEPDLLTFYTCYDNYLQVTHDYYPLKKPLNNNKKTSSLSNDNLDQTFQTCILHYCQYNNSRLSCINNSINRFNFQFNQIITPRCIKNITYAYFYSNNITQIEINEFMKQAWNLIYLELELPNLHSINTRAFYHLKHLLIMKLFSNRNLDLNIYKQLFQYIPNLIQITNKDIQLWNNCNDFNTTRMILSTTTFKPKYKVHIQSQIIFIIISSVTIIFSIFMFHFLYIDCHCIDYNVFRYITQKANSHNRIYNEETTV